MTPPVPNVSVSPDRSEERLRRLIEVGRSLVAALDLEAVFNGVLEAARELAGAMYAALDVFDEERRELKRLLTAGIDKAMHRMIRRLPRGRGVLSVLILEGGA